LELGRSFNQPIQALPSNLLQLTLGDTFDHPLENLGSSLVYLHLGSNFNQTVAAPPSLRYIKAHTKLELDDFTVFRPDPATSAKIYTRKVK
jgi:hypothetical protein